MKKQTLFLILSIILLMLVIVLSLTQGEWLTVIAALVYGQIKWVQGKYDNRSIQEERRV